MNKSLIGVGRRRSLAMPPRPAPAAVAVRESRVHSAAAEPAVVDSLPADALDDRIAIVGTAGSGKTYAAKGFVERLLDIGARVAIVDPLGMWWGLRASANGRAVGYPVVVFGGRHADVPITAEMGTALGRMIAGEALASTRSRKASGHLGNNSPGMVPLRLLFRDSPTIEGQIGDC